MKKGRTIVLAVMCFATVTFGQGSLTPSGAPAPTMKTLDQVEPRIAISSAPVSLDTSGSYYLTQSLTGTVTIAADNVSLDLMGFAINSSTGSAIRFGGSSRKNVRIHNGIILASKQSGIDFSISAEDANGCIEDIRISDCLFYGVVVGSGFIVRNVQVEGAGFAAIVVHGNSRVQDCLATASGKGLKVTGNGALIENNRIWGNTNNYDLTVGNQLNILLCDIPETLDWPCSVKLAGTLTCSQTNVDGITVNANDVSIDLDGHTLIGTGTSSGYGIYQVDTYRNLSVKNGKVVEWRGDSKGGIYVLGKACRIHGIQASTNYCGIRAGVGSTISDCTAAYNTGIGIHAYGCAINDCVARNNSIYGIYATYSSTLLNCVARKNADDGIYIGSGCTIFDSTVRENGGDGIFIYNSGAIKNCAAYNNGDDGIYANSGSTLSGCTAKFNIGDGIQASSDCRVVGNICNNNGFGGDGAGIHVTGHDNRIGNNHVTDNDRGIDVDHDGNFITSNTASGNATNWMVVTGNVCLVVNGTTSGTISGDSGGSAPGSTDPNANFTY